jgi:hypothetical protein
MPATTYDILIEQGATFEFELVWKDGDGDEVNLTGYTARMQVRPTVESSVVLLSLTSAAGGGITLGGATGAVTIRASATQTASIGARAAVYDLELQAADGTVTRLLQGVATISAEVTR